LFPLSDSPFDFFPKSPPPPHPKLRQTPLNSSILFLARDPGEVESSIPFLTPFSLFLTWRPQPLCSFSLSKSGSVPNFVFALSPPPKSPPFYIPFTMSGQIFLFPNNFSRSCGLLICPFPRFLPTYRSVFFFSLFCLLYPKRPLVFAILHFYFRSHSVPRVFLLHCASC